ncbi:hypothetical protein BpHYR1_032787 [Brachionus plicatilis]|uniref:Uncharacterized protein n=1 Tax=Brachionus plicatilis TaxID=10195 RepID=A0A3M7ST62_BRAPC|nr:hypothetical protein BpHYR1_032787 [Brachionus plicatilis]
MIHSIRFLSRLGLFDWRLELVGYPLIVYQKIFCQKKVNQKFVSTKPKINYPNSGKQELVNQIRYFLNAFKFSFSRLHIF